MIRKTVSCLLVLLLSTFCALSQTLEDSILLAEQLIEARRFSQARNLIRIRIHDFVTEEMLVHPTPEQLALMERGANDLREAQIRTGDISVSADFESGDMQFETPRELIRFSHLNFLWLNDIGTRTIYGKDDCNKTGVLCAEKSLELLRKYSDRIPDKDRIARTVWDDLLIAYGNIGDYNRIEATLAIMRETVEQIPYSSPDWPSIYWYYRALQLRKSGLLDASQVLLKDVLLHMLEYNPEFSVNPWHIYATTEADFGHFKAAHDITEQVFRVYREEELRQLRMMNREDRYSLHGSIPRSRNYYLLPDLPEGSFEDVLYDACLFSKNILLDLDRETDIFVNKGRDPELIHSYDCMKYLSGGPHSWYTSFVFQEQYRQMNTEPATREYSWRAVERKLGPKDVAIEFIRTGPGYSDYNALIVRHGWERPVMVPLGSGVDFNDIQADARTHRENALKTGQQVIVPLLPYLSPGDNFYYSPDGVIAQLNLDALELPGGTLVGDYFQIHRVTSTLDIPVKQDPEYHTLLLYGGMTYDAPVTEVIDHSALFHTVFPVEMKEWGREERIDESYTTGWIETNGKEERDGYENLRYTGDEVERIRQAWRKHGNCYIYKGIHSIEESIKYWGLRDTLPEHSILHIATHSISRKIDLSKYWMLSSLDKDFKGEGLLFSGARTAIDGLPFPEDKMNDGILWGEEIARLDLNNAELVVLSACHTARGQNTLDGVLGLQRAFKHAGAGTIIMTLWRVNDKATMTFMSRFYQELFSGKSKYDSFKSAQVHVRAEYSDDPYFWAPFIMLD